MQQSMIKEYKFNQIQLLFCKECLILIMNMANSIKQITNLLINFIDQTFLPLFQVSIPEVSKAMQQWDKLKNFIHDTEVIQTWKLENFLGELSKSNINHNFRKISSQHPDKNGVILRPPQLYQSDVWKYRSNDFQTRNLVQPQKKVYSSALRTDMPRVQDRLDGKNIEYFENLLSSFKTLCTNFQNNHKKLVIDRQTFPV